MVGSEDSVWGGRLLSRRVWLVMGPMEMRGMLRGRDSPAAARSASRLVTVEELVKVMASG
jgi:hypothetical protein